MIHWGGSFAKQTWKFKLSKQICFLAKWISTLIVMIKNQHRPQWQEITLTWNVLTCLTKYSHLLTCHLNHTCTQRKAHHFVSHPLALFHWYPVSRSLTIDCSDLRLFHENIVAQIRDPPLGFYKWCICKKAFEIVKLYFTITLPNSC